MKYYALRIAIGLCLAQPIYAQQTFTLTPNPVFGVDINSQENEGAATIQNLSSTLDTFRWKRTIIRLEYDSVCETQVTDAFNHWHPIASEKNFWLSPGQQAPMNISLWDFTEAGCCAIVHLKIKKLSGTPDSIEAFYYLRTCQPLAVSEAQKPSIELYPNPVGQYFDLRQAASVHQMTLCDGSGKMLRRMQANAEQHYEMANLPAGAYYLILEDRAGQIMQVLTFFKE